MKFDWIFSAIFGLLLVITKSIVLSINVASINQDAAAPEAAATNQERSIPASTDIDSTISYVIRQNRFNDTDHPRKSLRFQHNNANIKLDNFN